MPFGLLALGLPEKLGGLTGLAQRAIAAICASSRAEPSHGLLPSGASSIH